MLAVVALALAAVYLALHVVTPSDRQDAPATVVFYGLGFTAWALVGAAPNERESSPNAIMRCCPASRGRRLSESTTLAWPRYVGSVVAWTTAFALRRRHCY